VGRAVEAAARLRGAGLGWQAGVAVKSPLQPKALKSAGAGARATKGAGTEGDVESGDAPAAAMSEEEKSKEQWRKYRKMAWMMASAQSRRLWKWVKTSPLSLRVLGFLSGFFLFITCFIGWFFNLFSGHELAMILNLWILVFSLLIIVIEIKLSFIEQYVLKALEEQAQFLATITGRGCFLIFTGLMAMSLILRGVWQNALLFGAGCFSVLVGLAMVIQGALVLSRFSSLRAKMAARERVEEEFRAADQDQSGGALSSTCPAVGALCCIHVQLGHGASSPSARASCSHGAE
jgi:hypothetical protein